MITLTSPRPPFKGGFDLTYNRFHVISPKLNSHKYMNMKKRIPKKIIFLSLMIVCLSLVSKATTYYVSNNGNDTYSGISTALPWKTLDKVNATTFKAGDQILFERGSTFYGSLTVNQSGASGNPITFGAYGTGVNPVITGFTTVTAWTDLGSNIWESTNTVSTLSTCNMVTVNGVNTAMGRYPNADLTNGGFLTIQSNPSTTSITNTTLTGTPNWTGAELVMRSNDWTMEKRTITSQSGSTLNYNTACSPVINYGFFIQNDSRTLDQQNEWYFNPSTKKIRMYSASQPTNVKVTSVDDLFTFSASIGYVNVDGIDFSGANSRALYRWAYGTLPQKVHNINITNCYITYCGTDAVSVCSYTLNVENNTISETNGIAMNLSSSRNVVVRNNAIHNSSLLPGMGVSFSAIQVGESTNNTILIEYNSITNTGHNAISFGADTTTIKNNFIDTFNTILDDGAGIYGGSNCKITNNIVLNGIGAWKGTAKTNGGLVCGIYLDDNSNHNEVGYNTVSGCAWIGLYLHNTNTNNLHHNVIYNNNTQLRTADDNLGGDVFGNLIQNNQFIAKSSTQMVCDFSSNQNNLTGIGTFDNNYYARPINEGNTISTNQPSGSASRTLENWKTFSGQDANSKASPQTITDVNDLQFEYNATKTAKTVTLSQSMIDVKGTKYTGSIILQPYTSVVLMKDQNPASDVPIVSDNRSSQTMEIYPNPSCGKFVVRFVNLTIIGSRIEVFDVAGRRVLSRMVKSNVEEFNLSGLAEGLYVVKSIMGSEEKIQKLLIQH
jgi:parallel beta-helix repeat protein